MPRRGSRVKESRVSVTRGTTTRIFITSTDEATHNSGKDEEIPRAVHSTTIYHFPPGQGDGSNIEVTTCVGQILKVV
jgi:hypothetical protein